MWFRETEGKQISVLLSFASKQNIFKAKFGLGIQTVSLFLYIGTLGENAIQTVSIKQGFL